MSSRYHVMQNTRRPNRGNKEADTIEADGSADDGTLAQPEPKPRCLTLEDYLQISEELFFFRTSGMTRH